MDAFRLLHALLASDRNMIDAAAGDDTLFSRHFIARPVGKCRRPFPAEKRCGQATTTALPLHAIAFYASHLMPPYRQLLSSLGRHRGLVFIILAMPLLPFEREVPIRFEPSLMPLPMLMVCFAATLTFRGDYATGDATL